MKIGKTVICILAICISCGTALYAGDYPDWESYPSMFSMIDVIEFKGYVYGVSKSGIFRYDPESREYKLFYKNHGLAADDVLSIAATSQELIVGFQSDGLIRFNPEDETFEPILFPEYVNKEDVLKTLAVNDIFALNDSILYIGHSKGVDRLNLNTEELRTYSKLSPDIQEDIPVNEVKIFKGKLWACTPDGLAWADADNPNLEFEENWESVKFDSGVNCIINYVSDDEDIIYVGTDRNGIFTLDIENKQIKESSYKTKAYSFSNAFGTCFAASSEGLLKKSFNTWYLYDSSILPLRALSPVSNGKIWVATADDGLQCYTMTGYMNIPPINGPRSSTLRKLYITEDNVIWAATSWRDDGGYVHRFDDEIWVSYGKDEGLFTTNAVFVDSLGNIWCSTWGKGLYVLDDNGTPGKMDDTITRVDPSNEIIVPYEGNYVVCSDVTADKYGNIWIASYYGVNVLEGDLPIRDFKHHYFPAFFKGTQHFIIKVFPDDDGWVWLGTWETGVIGLYVGEDPYDTSDDEIKFISPESLHSNRVEAIHSDKDGYVWIGTDGGLNRIIKSSGNELEVKDMNHLIGEDAFKVNCIEVDRFNNKWLGTSLGLVKLDSDNKLVGIYTTENSGIFLNYDILSLKYDNKKDILWVGTDTGLNKFHVLEADSGDSGDIVHVYPNPFEIWGNNSKAHFTNLKPHKPVRIYNFNGELVNEVISDGNGIVSTAVWNGSNFKGEFVGSGVYFFTGTNSKGSVFRGKMVVIRR